MKLRVALLTAVLGMAVPLTPVLVAAPAQAQTIASKLQMLGEMTYVKVAGLKSTRRNGLLFVQATLANTNNVDQQVAYRVKWLDQDGFDAWDEEAWKPLVLHGLQQTNIQVTAPTRNATDFRIELHSPENSASQAAGAGPAASTQPRP
ncbi:hypothetical protein PTE30175_01552 [Pandoraea terrae]|uniref:DUF1425 domain-containing protein n=1 Tax=Pandoraea terrae TaxID=1537710 RepID=A0A5E4TYR0_9BURK|nr:YcfL family protein [Pandoraea terrae]VVD91019.1 hypothetical protein PTE30175_01552 [Pandoraea terrae]